MKLMFCPSLVHNEKMFQCVPASVRMESKLAPMNYMLGP